MDKRFDIREILRRYNAAYKEAITTKRYLLSYHDIEDWNAKLNPVEMRTYQDIRAMGLPLYPIYPFSDSQYMHFANPFEKVGIEIVFKNSPPGLIERKTKLLESLGWTIYRINSESTYHILEDFFRIKRTDQSFEWEDIDGDRAFRFADKFKAENAPCLLYYLQQRYFVRVEV